MDDLNDSPEDLSRVGAQWSAHRRGPELFDPIARAVITDMSGALGRFTSSFEHGQLSPGDERKLGG